MKVIDMHCDTIYRLLCKKDSGENGSLRENEGHIDLLRMKQSSYLLQNFAMFVELDRDGDPWERVQRIYGHYQSEMEKNSDLIAPVLQFSDIAANEAAGKMSSLLTVEEGAVCKGELSKLQTLYDMGVRMITLTWNFPNELGYPNNVADNIPNLTGGLTEKGKEFVARMEELGIIPDVSHLSDAGFFDVLQVTKKPFAASHSDARAVCPCVRNLTDEMIKALADRGGVTGLNYCEAFLKEQPAGKRLPASIQDVARHARHIVNVGGLEVLGLGSDFDGIGDQEELPGAQSMGRLWEGLKKSGFTERELDKIFYQNVLRLYRETLR